MPQCHIVAILYPTPGKEARFDELMKGMCATVEAKESDCKRYMMTKKLDSDTPEVIMIETQVYDSKDVAEKHAKTDHYTNLLGTLQSEGLLAKDPYIVKSVTEAGFDLR